MSHLIGSVVSRPSNSGQAIQPNTDMKTLITKYDGENLLPMETDTVESTAEQREMFLEICPAGVCHKEDRPSFMKKTADRGWVLRIRNCKKF